MLNGVNRNNETIMTKRKSYFTLTTKVIWENYNCIWKRNFQLYWIAYIGGPIIIKRTTKLILIRQYIYIYIYIYEDPHFFPMALLLIVHIWKSRPLWSNLLRLQCTCCTVPTTSRRPHGSPLVWECHSLFHLLSCLITTASELRE